MALWQIWVIIAIALFIAEIFTPGFLLACFGVGCLATGLASFIGIGPKVQIVVFSVAVLVVFFGIRPFFLRHMFSKKGMVATNVDALINKIGIVTEIINNDTARGRIRVGGEDWKAVSLDGKIVEVGHKVIIEKVEGSKLLVREKREE